MTLTKRRRARTRTRTHSPIGRPHWDHLEARIVLTSVIGTSPAADSVLTASPSTFRVRFDSPLNAQTVASTDVFVQSMGQDGSLRPAFDTPEFILGAVDPDDPSSFVLIPPSSLEPGHYRLVLSGSSHLTGLDGSPAADPEGRDLALADFTVGRPGVGLADAVDLGPVGPVVREVQGALDFQANPSDVALYEVTLGRGHRWRLGVEVAAQTQGSPLDSLLTLFDATGRPIRSVDAGRPGSENDPYLFVGLDAGHLLPGRLGPGGRAGRARRVRPGHRLARPGPTPARRPVHPPRGGRRGRPPGRPGRLPREPRRPPRPPPPRASP